MKEIEIDQINETKIRPFIAENTIKIEKDNDMYNITIFSKLSLTYKNIWLTKEEFKLFKDKINEVEV